MPGSRFDNVVIETFHRIDPKDAFAQHVHHRHAHNILRDPFARDLYRMAHDRIRIAQARKPSKAVQTLNQAKRIRDQSAEVVGKEFPSDSAKTKAKDDMLSQVDLLLLREGVTDRGAAALKNQVKANFEQATVRSRESIARTQAKAKKHVHKTITDPKAPKYVRRNALWAARDELSPVQFENRMKRIMTEGQKAIDLLPEKFRAKSGVKLPRRFEPPTKKEVRRYGEPLVGPQRKGRWRKK